MKKIAAGILAGAMLMVSAQALGAAVTLVGKKIQGEYTVKVYGKKLADAAVVIDGKSYVPVRAIGELAGYKVTVSGKTINLDERNGSSLLRSSNNPDKSMIGPMPSRTTAPAMSTAKSRIEAIDGKIDVVVDNILNTSSLLKSDPENTELKQQLEEYKEDYADLLKQKDDELQK